MAALAAALFGFLFRDALLDPSLALLGPADGAFAHAALRFVTRGWLAGEAPLWNPHVGAGAPALGHPFLGVFDPQTQLQVALGAVGGARLASWSFAALALVRAVAATLGAFSLARSLGLRAAGAAVAAFTFAGAGYFAVHAVEAADRVLWIAPWLLLAIERVRRSRGASGLVAVATLTALMIYAGHPEVVFYVGALALVWSIALLREDARAGRNALAALVCGLALGAPVLAPFLEYATRSSLANLRAADRPFDLLGLGLLAILAGAVWRARELASRLGHEARLQQRFAVGAALVFALFAVGIAALDPWPDAARLALLPDLFGRPGLGAAGFYGRGEFAPSVSAWIAPFGLTFAFAGMLAPDLGPFRNARIVRFGAAIALLLALAAPGAADLAHLVPVLKLSDPRNAGGVAALLLGLLAGAAFEHAATWARWTAASTASLCIGALVFAAGRVVEPAEPRFSLDPPSELIGLVARPSERLAYGEIAFEGWIHPELQFATAAVRVDPSAHEVPLPLELSTEPWRPAFAELAPSGAVWFRARQLRVSDLADGAWRFALVLRDAQGRELSERWLAGAVVHRPQHLDLVTLVLAFAAAFGAAWLRPRPILGWRDAAPTGAAVILVVASIVGFQRGLQSTREFATLFGTQEFAARMADAAEGGRIASDVGALPRHGALANGYRCVDEDDGLGIGQFDATRVHGLIPGVHAALGWNASGIDLGSPLARLLDLRLVVRDGAFERAGWTAIEDAGGLRRYRALAPLGAATCVAQSVNTDYITRYPRDFDPARQVHLSGAIGWEARHPFTNAAVEVLARTNRSIELEAELDGDGMVVVSEQLFPGWSAEVDGRSAQLLSVDSLFCGVALSAGKHSVVLRYRPGMLRVGLFAATIALLALARLLWRARTPSS